MSYLLKYFYFVTGQVCPYLIIHQVEVLTSGGHNAGDMVSGVYLIGTSIVSLAEQNIVITSLTGTFTHKLIIFYTTKIIIYLAIFSQIHFSDFFLGDIKQNVRACF